MDKIEHKLPAIVIILNGIICLIYTEQVYALLPSLLGLMMVLRGFTLLVSGVRKHDFSNVERGEIGFSIVSLIIGFGVLVRQNEAIYIVGVFWGIYGLKKAAVQCNELLYRRLQLTDTYKKNTVLVIQMFVGFIMSTVLIFDPFTKTQPHVLLLGIELIYEGVTEIWMEHKKKN